MSLSLSAAPRQLRIVSSSGARLRCCSGNASPAPRLLGRPSPLSAKGRSLLVAQAAKDEPEAVPSTGGVPPGSSGAGGGGGGGDGSSGGSSGGAATGAVLASKVVEALPAGRCKQHGLAAAAAAAASCCCAWSCRLPRKFIHGCTHAALPLAPCCRRAGRGSQGGQAAAGDPGAFPGHGQEPDAVLAHEDRVSSGGGQGGGGGCEAVVRSDGAG